MIDMAWVAKFICITCREDIHEARLTNDFSMECSRCKAKKADKNEIEWKAGREGLSIEERLRELENFMYHHGTHYKPTTFV